MPAVVTKLKALLPHALLILAGGLTTLAFAPYTLWWLPLLTQALLVFFLQRAASARQACLYGFSYGLGWFGVGISWVHVSIDQFGGLPLAGSLSLMALLVGYLALFPLLASGLSYQLRLHRLMPLLFAASWTLAEWLRSVMLTGFPWLSLGYSQTSAGLKDLAPLIGETGISFVLAFSAAALAQLTLQQKPLARYSYVLVAGIIFAASPQLTAFKGWQHTDKTLSVLLVQGNIKQELRWAPEQEWPTMLKYMDLTRPHFQSDLVIWPEAAIPQLEPLAESYLDNLNRAALYANTAVISGILDYNFKTQQAWNNLIVLGKRNPDSTDGDYFYGHGNRYSKHHLLPIGEFVPMEDWLRKLAPIFDLPMSSFTRGSYVQPNLVANGYHLLPAICFEIAFPAQIAANMTADTQLLLTVSNDAWFGDSIGPLQHLQIAQMRALEFGRPLLRATNNGVTATVNAAGEISKVAPQFTEAVLTDTVRLTAGATPYSRFGDTPLQLLSITLLLCCGARRYTLRNASHSGNPAI
ncbi:apolipoprotein N-acyltransferase [Rheinheimera aquimaris]|uniref:apolipoprotein N-acyltransferase n=1 Tax=Rheinheimera aquimaris TaxID=412437 RepID=UPI003A96B25F